MPSGSTNQPIRPNSSKPKITLTAKEKDKLEAEKAKKTKKA